MKIVIDMNLPPVWVDYLIADGWAAVHWADIGALNAPDPVILAWAQANGYVVFTHDLDFGDLLAASGETGPSVLQVRSQNVLPDSIGPLVTGALRQFADMLAAGALVSITASRQRARVLPLRHP